MENWFEIIIDDVYAKSCVQCKKSLPGPFNWLYWGGRGHSTILSNYNSLTMNFEKFDIGSTWNPLSDHNQTMIAVGFSIQCFATQADTQKFPISFIFIDKLDMKMFKIANLYMKSITVKINKNALHYKVAFNCTVKYSYSHPLMNCHPSRPITSGVTVNAGHWTHIQLVGTSTNQWFKRVCSLTE